MIKLIQNELTKIFKKKNIYILLIVTLAFIIFFNYMNATHSSSSQSYMRYSQSYMDYVRDRVTKLDPNKPEDITEYIEMKAMADLFDLTDKYDESAWQLPIIEQKATGYLRSIYIYSYGAEKNEESKLIAQKNYQDFIAKLEHNDWHYFVEEELKDVEMQIQNLKLQKQILDWRLEKQIPYGYNPMNQYLNQYQSAQSQCYSFEKENNLSYDEQKQQQSAIKTASLAKYHIEHDNISDKQSQFQDGMITIFSSYELFIIIMIVMIAGTIVSEEFNKGTIKLLLVRPYSRTKILVAKLLTAMIVLALTILIIILMQVVVGGIAFGFDGIQTTIAEYDFNLSQVVTFPLWQYVGILLLAKLPLYLLILMIAFAISTIFTNSPLAIVISLLGYMSTTIINSLAQAYQIDILKYFITMNWNMEQYLFGALPPFEGMTFTFSIIVCILYFVVMLIPTIIFFKKKNIKNI